MALDSPEPDQRNEKSVSKPPLTYRAPEASGGLLKMPTFSRVILPSTTP